MEKQLVEIRDSLRVLSNIQNMDDTNPIIHRISNSTVRRVHCDVAALREPHQEILPLNVIWFDFNPASPYYGAARRRVSKQADAAAGTVHTWQVIETMAEYEVDQYYDQEDSDLLSQNDPVPPATTTVLGVAKLSVAPKVGSVPVVVGEGDPRLTDARKPTEHTHAEKPATMFKTKNSTVSISDSPTPVVGATLVSNGSGKAVWRQLTSSDIQR